MRVRVFTAAAALTAFALVAPVGADQPTAHLTDPAGDANALNGQGLTPAVPAQNTSPASYAPADLRSVRFETLHRAVPVGADGIRYEATGLAVHVVTEAMPKSDGPTLLYRINTSVGGCGGFLQAFLRGASSTPNDPADKSIQWRTFASRGCVDGDKTVTNAKWTVTTDAATKSLTMTFPFSSLSATQARAMAVGADIAGTIAEVRTNLGTPAASATAPSIDEAVGALEFIIGSDMPADVPCTEDCP